MLPNICRLWDIGTSCYELISMMELGKFEKGPMAKSSRQRWFSPTNPTAPSSGDVALH